MRILFLTSAHNSLSQRAMVELRARGHQVTVELALSSELMLEAVGLARPELIVAPFLTTGIPEAIWQEISCLIVHPGIRGDRGASSLDWAISEGETEWGVTVLEAVAEFDAGDIWASSNFVLREASKSSIYKNEVVDAAIRALLLAVERFESGEWTPVPLDYDDPTVRGRARPRMMQRDRTLDWRAPTVEVLRQIRAADGSPGVRDRVAGKRVYLYGAHAEDQLRGEAGQILGQRNGAVCIATGDGAVWVSHMKRPRAIKLPAARVLGDALRGVPEVPLGLVEAASRQTFRELWYEERGDVGTLHFDFYNGAMDTEQCQRLLSAWRFAVRRPTKVLVLAGGLDYWSNGIHLNQIGVAKCSGDASWRNIHAINDVIREIIHCETHLVVASMHGSAGAGGAMMALAADRVVARQGIVLNPHYKSMGGLYGSEYWTYLLPKRVGAERARELTEGLVAIGAEEAARIGFVDVVVEASFDAYRAEVWSLAQGLAAAPDFAERLATKRERRYQDEQVKPLESYRYYELIEMHRNFFGDDDSYHRAVQDFVRKQPAEATPIHLARHRSGDGWGW